MSRYTLTALSDAFGIQHAEDEYYLRPLILGDNLFTYVAHIPPGGGVPPYPEAAQRWQIEHSLYVLDGSIRVTLRGESVTLVPHTAVRIPAGDAVEMENVGDRTASIYMAYTPSAWGPSSPREDRREVTSLDEMRAWFEQRGQRVWSPSEMNVLAGDFATLKQSLSELDDTYHSIQSEAGGQGEKLWAALWEIDGYRHEHKPHPPDDFWFRPIVSGEKHLTYIGMVPPGMGVDPSAEEAGFVEMSIYTLGGELGCIILGEDGEEEERLVLPPHQAIYAPKYVPIGFFNVGPDPASFALTFTPTRPGRESLAAFRQWAVHTAGWTVIDPGPLNEMHGDTLWDLDS
ncbi:MAG TPA: cupin domain-containing protein [Anaerolineae bacterium]|nr:cupin domain-containing protein [Anaerolineae bacterium]